MYQGCHMLTHLEAYNHDVYNNTYLLFNTHTHNITLLHVEGIQIQKLSKRTYMQINKTNLIIFNSAKQTQYSSKFWSFKNLEQDFKAQKQGIILNQ
jgi:hypothetical protein